MNARRAQTGFSLPEIMVALTIGLLLLAAFLNTLDRCRAQFAASNSVASLQDTARYVLSVLVPDIEHAGFLGFAASALPQLVRDAAVISDAALLMQPDGNRPAAPVAGLPPGAHDCGINFAVDLTIPVQMTDNAYPPGPDRCDPTAAAGGARTGSDTLTIRRTSFETTEPRVGRLQVYSRRLATRGVALFSDGIAPGPADPDSEVRDLEVRTYYIANNSVGRPGWPALRVKSLTESGGRAQFRDEEVLPGVEDLQVEIAMAEDPAPNLRFAAPDLAHLREHPAVAVRLWLRLRADDTEAGYTDARPLHYAGVSFMPSDEEARHRRMLIERTVALRNLRLP